MERAIRAAGEGFRRLETQGTLFTAYVVLGGWAKHNVVDRSSLSFASWQDPWRASQQRLPRAECQGPCDLVYE
jgi:hypothetical protein